MFLSVVIVLIILIILYLIAQGYYDTRNMRNLAKKIEKAGSQNFSYNIYSEAVWSGFFKGEIWGPNNTYLKLGTMHLEDSLEEYTFFQINDTRVCTTGFVKFVSFVESQTGETGLTFTEALLRMDSAYEIYKSQLEMGHSPKFPRKYYDVESQKYYITDSGDCEPQTEINIPAKLKKSIRYR